MAFEQTYQLPVLECKLLEANWFFHEKNGKAEKKQAHSMPFMRRNLTYSLGIGLNVGKGGRKVKPTTETAEPDTSKCPDLLLKLFKHRPKSYNKAYLPSLKRSDRKPAAKKTPNQPTQETREVEKEAPHLAVATRRCKNQSIEATNEKGAAAAGVSDDSNGLDSNPKRKALNAAEAAEEGSPPRKLPRASDKNEEVADISLRESSVAEAHSLNDENLPPPTLSPLSNSIDEDATMSILTWSRPEGKDHSSDDAYRGSSAIIRPRTRVVFHFLFPSEGGHVRMLTDTTSDQNIGHRRCPLCYFDGESDAGLLIHCVFCHGEKLNFKAARSEDGTLHVAVTRKPVGKSGQDDHLRDFIHIRQANTQTLGIPSVPFLKRNPAKAAAMDLPTRRKKIRLLQEIGADKSVVEQLAPTGDTPVRQYFHSRTNAPMLDGEWDVDSDDEPDESWLHKMSEALMDEFEDVTPQEKLFMKLWNKFMKSHTEIADRALPTKCAQFLEKYKDEMVKLNLRQEWLLHLCNMWDFGLLSSSHLLGFINDFDQTGKQQQPPDKQQKVA